MQAEIGGLFFHSRPSMENEFVDPRQEGEALWPEKYSPHNLERIRGVLGSYKFASLYQQTPRPREGGMFKEHWLKLVDAVPAQARRVRWWDKASTEGGGDFTAGTLVAYADGIWYVEDIVSGQWSSGERSEERRVGKEGRSRG